MDNLTHTLCGLALARVGLDRRGPLVTPLLAVAANFPDCDIVWAKSGVSYLEHHRGGTHSLAGIAVETAVLAGATYGLGRLARVKGTRLAPLVLAALVGLLSHFGLDLLNSYGVRPWLPFDGRRWFGDLAFIVDPWLWLGFGAAAYVGVARGPRVRALWAALGSLVVLAAALAASGGITSSGVAPLLAAAIVGTAWLERRVGDDERRRRRLARIFGAGVLAYLALLGVASRAARARALGAVEARLSGGERVVGSSVNPAPAIPWRATVAVETGERVYVLAVDLATGTADVRTAVEKHLDDPVLARLEGTLELAAWRAFARHPFVAHVGGAVILGDARYDPRPERSWCNLEVVPPPARR